MSTSEARADQVGRPTRTSNGSTTVAADVRRMIRLGVAAAVFSGLFILSFGYAQHAPRPHAVRIDIVAPASVVGTTRFALAQAVPGGFIVQSVPTQAVARERLEQMRSSGALVLPPNGQAEILTAGAAGAPLQQVVVKALTNVSAAQGRTAGVDDVVAVHSTDRAGLSVFSLELGLLVPSVVGAIGLYLAGRRARVLTRVVGAMTYSVVAAGLAVVVIDLLYGALPGSPWTLFGDATLIAATFALTVVALHCLLGLPGTALAGAVLVVVGNAVNGSAVPTNMLPDGYRQIAPWIPNNAAIRLLRSDLYFGGHGQSGPLLTLGIWLGISLIVLISSELTHRRFVRIAHPEHGWQVYSIPLVVYLRDHLRPIGHRSGSSPTRTLATSTTSGARHSGSSSLKA